MKKKILTTLLLSSIMATSPSSLMAFKAKKTFRRKCSTCHTIGKGDYLGPDLKGIFERREEAWLIRFIRSSEKMISSGDEKALALFHRFKKQKMPSFSYSDENIKTLLAYISKKGKEATSTASTPVAATTHEADEPARDGKSLASECISCHGPLGTSGNPLFPHLRGQHGQYLYRQLQAFKNGTRKDPSRAMNKITEVLSDLELKNIAEYYAGLKK